MSDIKLKKVFSKDILESINKEYKLFTLDFINKEQYELKKIKIINGLKSAIILENENDFSTTLSCLLDEKILFNNEMDLIIQMVKYKCSLAILDEKDLIELYLNTNTNEEDKLTYIESEMCKRDCNMINLKEYKQYNVMDNVELFNEYLKNKSVTAKDILEKRGVNIDYIIQINKKTKMNFEYIINEYTKNKEVFIREVDYVSDSKFSGNKFGKSVYEVITFLKDTSIRIQSKASLIKMVVILIICVFSITTLSICFLVKRNRDINNEITRVRSKDVYLIEHMVPNKKDAIIIKMMTAERLENFQKLIKNDIDSACKYLSPSDVKELDNAQDIKNVVTDNKDIMEFGAEKASTYIMDNMPYIGKAPGFIKSAIEKEVAEGVLDIINWAAGYVSDITTKFKIQKIVKNMKMQVETEKYLKENKSYEYNKILAEKELKYEISVRDYDIENEQYCLQKYEAIAEKVRKMYFSKGELRLINSHIDESRKHLSELKQQEDSLKKEFSSKIEKLKLEEENRIKNQAVKNQQIKEQNNKDLPTKVQQSIDQGINNIQQSNEQQTKKDSTPSTAEKSYLKPGEVPSESSTFAIPTDGATANTPKGNRIYFKKDGVVYFRDKTKVK